jgi:gluconate 2-dehydrogenase alpha chain
MTIAGAGFISTLAHGRAARTAEHLDMTDQNNSNPRRTFLLQAAGLTAAGSLLKAASPADAAAATAPVPAAAPDAASVPYQSLSPDEATFIEALVNVMCPADEYSPNGADCGIAAYIDRQLAGPYGKGDGRYLQGPFRSGKPQLGLQLPLTPEQFCKAGIAAANAACMHEHGKPFEQLTPAQADEFLKAVAADRVPAAESLRYRAFPQPAANSSGPYRNPDGQQLGQCQYCGHCERFICEAHAKSTPATLLYPMLRTRPSFELRTRAHVLRVDYDRRAKRATGVRYLDLNSGEEYQQPADIVVMAAFTMTNTRLLLLGGIGQPYSPAARRGVVGKNFCYQTSSGVDVFFRNRWINPFLAAGSTAMVIDEFNNDNFDHSVLPFLGGASIDVLVTNGRPIRARRTPPGTPGWGSAWKKATADWYSHSFTVGAQGSCYPHRENFLDLDPDYTDIYGQRLLRMTFDFRENELRMSEWVTQKVGEICRAMAPHLLGAVEGLRGQFDTRQYQTTHVTGGTIMGADPHSSVVSPHLQHWDAENLFVVGASVYPHNSGYNPTGPLAALALRLGDDLARYIERPRML